MSFASDIERGTGNNGRSFGGAGGGGFQGNGGGYQAGGFGNSGPGRDDDYNYEKNQVSSNIKTMAAYFQQIIDSSSSLGTERDSAEFRENLCANVIFLDTFLFFLLPWTRVGIFRVFWRDLLDALCVACQAAFPLFSVVFH